jgi:Icc protein
MSGSTGFRIAHLSDIHCTADRAAIKGIDTWDNFDRAVADCAGHEIDHIVLSGDLANDPNDAGPYRFIRERIETLAVPYSIIPGNHDRLALMREAFPEPIFAERERMYYQRRLGPLSCVFLDTATGTVDSAQMNWFESAFAAMPAPRCLFMHHPPARCGVPLMDRKYPLENMDELQGAFSRLPATPLVFCGHYHVEKSVVAKCCTIMITPSTWYQLRQDIPEWGVDHTRIGYRLIDCVDQTVRTTVRYLDAPAS